MALREILDAIESRMKLVMAELGERPPSFGRSTADLHRSSTPPRIVFVPVGGPVRRPRAVGGSDGPLWQREHRCRVEIWGKDFDATELLMERLVNAMQDVFGGSYELIEEAWDTSGEASKGVPMALLMSFLLPIPKTPQALAQAEQGQTTGLIVQELS